MDLFDKNKTCAFTGHRPEKMPNNGDENSSEIKYIKKMLREEILNLISKGFMYFISGMGRGFDLWAAQTVIELQEEGSNIFFIAAIPFIGQELRWHDADKALYDKIIRKARFTFCLSDTNSIKSYFLRNDYMVENSSCIIAYYSGIKGGTKYTVNLALRQGLNIINIADGQLTLF